MAFITLLPCVAVDMDPATLPVPGAGQVLPYFTEDGVFHVLLSNGTTLDGGGGGASGLPAGGNPSSVLVGGAGNPQWLTPSSVGLQLTSTGQDQLGWALPDGSDPGQTS